MRFSPKDWLPIKSGAAFAFDGQLLEVNSSEHVAVYVEDTDGRMAVAGAGFSVSVRVPPGVTVTCKSKGEIFVKLRELQLVPSTGEIYSSLDVTPEDGGTLAVVRKALHDLKVKQYLFRQEQKAKHAAIKAERAAQIREAEPEEVVENASPGSGSDEPEVKDDGPDKSSE